MKIAFAMNHLAFFRLFDGVVRQLCQDGHTVELLFGDVDKPGISDRAVRACEDELPGCHAGPLLARADWRRLPLLYLRSLLGYASYLAPEHPSPPVLANRMLKHLPRLLRLALRPRIARGVLATGRAQRWLRRMETLAPPDRAIIRWLAAARPDIVVASPFILPQSGEVEYVKAAQVLGIPTVVPVASWDNLTTKGTFVLMPDRVIVWNQNLADEVVRWHAVPRDRIVITGAAVFDPWFQMQPTVDRETFARQVGIDPRRPYVVYLCSSGFISRDETAFVGELVQAIRTHPDSCVRATQVVVRPHPVNPGPWDDFVAEGIAVWPRGGNLPDVPEARQDYFNTLYHSAGVVGVNTSAFLEAAITDRPCLTLLTDHHRQRQVELPHFHHLLNADFLETAADFDAFTEILAGVLCGEDSRAARRRQFVQDFIRPGGMTQNAAAVMARAIETAAVQGNGALDG